MPLTAEGLLQVEGLASRYVRLADGSRAHYMTAGETGPNVVLLHGGIPGFSGLAGWRYMAPFLGANGFRVYCPDQPGFGLADTAPAYRPVHGVFSHIEFLEQFAAALGLDRFFLAGNSMGCLNTAHYVLRYPHRVTAFALIAGGLGSHVPQGIDKHRETISWDGQTATMRKMMELIIRRKDRITDDLLEMQARAADLQAESWQAWWHAFAQGGMARDLGLAISTRGRLDRLSHPAIYLYGQDDEMFPVEMGYLQEDALPNVQFFYPADCGHQGQTDQPELFNQVFLEFFRDGRVSRATADRAGVSKRRPELPQLVEAADVEMTGRTSSVGRRTPSAP